jgi:hypothetical protein
MRVFLDANVYLLYFRLDDTEQHGRATRCFRIDPNRGLAA